jgi:hypothetical protein
MWTKILKYQLFHLLALLILIPAIYLCLVFDYTFLVGELWGFSTFFWFLLSVLSTIIHQIYVLICWRLELHHQSLTKAFGTKAFRIYQVGFAILILSRPLLISLLAVSNAETLDLNQTAGQIIAALLCIPVVYLFYSVRFYFGFERAFGIDHFQPEKYKNVPFVKQGIFKYTDNGMYIYGFLLLWIPGFLLCSKAALLAALFNQIYIWVHYYCTELPDMKIIYEDL